MGVPTMPMAGFPVSTYTTMSFSTPPMSILMTGRVTLPWACMMEVVTSTSALNTSDTPRTVIIWVASTSRSPE